MTMADDRVPHGEEEMMTAAVAVGDSEPMEHHVGNCPNQVKEGEGGGLDSGSASPSSSTDSKPSSLPPTAAKGKSCKGCLYYSATLKSNSKSPFCFGLVGNLPQVPRHIIGKSEMEASKEGRSLVDFRYACLGYSIYRDQRSNSTDIQEKGTELPACLGIEILVDKRASAASPAPSPAPAHIHNKEDVHGFPQSRSPRPTHSVGDEFLSRFTRNAGLVANGVAKNMRKVGNHIKERIDDLLLPYRRRPK